MADIIEMLALSPTMEEGTLVEWLKNEGDTVEEGEIIAEIETDKATMEMESFFDGTLLKLIAQPGEAIAVGAPLAIIGEEGESIDDLLAEIEGGSAGGGKKDDGGGEEAARASDESSDSGGVGTPDDATEAAPAASTRGDDERIFSSPLARRMAADKGIELSAIEGTGPRGRIVAADVERAEREGTGSRASGSSRAAAPKAAAAQPTQSASEHDLSQMRKTIARRLGQAWNDVPHFFLTMEIDMAATMAIRKEVNDQLAETEAGVKLSVNDFIVKACGIGLERYPDMNRSFRGDHFVEFTQADIGVAVAIEDGLITPVVRNVGSKSLTAISREIRELAGRARDKKLKPEEYSGSTFSISNLGMFGIDHFTAIINPPEAGILACGAVKQVPVVEDGELTVGTRMKVTLSCDHRIVDGATGAEFLNVVKRHLENPYLLMV
jgi:pyruvate dehydrogenase E2 component (dihydrolipoamide acetyltransferase)